MPVIYKSEDNTVDFDAITKAVSNFNETGELLAVVYAPEIRDAQGDIASADVIKQMAYEHAKSGLHLDVMHDGKPLSKDRAYVAENFIIAKGDERFSDWKDSSGKPVNVAGGWGQVIKIEDPELRKQYREGKWNGVSMAGPAQVETETEKSERIAESFAKHLGNPFSIIKNMDETKFGEALAKALAPALAAQSASILDGIGKLLPKQEEKKVEKKDEPKGDGPGFDVLNPEEVRKHLVKTQREQLAKTVDWNDPKAVSNYLASIEKADGKADGKTEAEESPEAQALRKQLEDTQAQLNAVLGKSGQPVSEKGAAADETISAIAKMDANTLKRGRQMASYINGNRGYKS